MVSMKKEQLEFLNWEFGAFFHFGIRSFNEGHKDWDMKPMELSSFNPTEFDCEEWISTIKEAGANYAVLVCKHHDGFALWPSKYTDYSVASSPWKNGKGDVVKEFEKKGFVNIRTEVKYDIITEWFTKDGEIEKVIINDESKFSTYDEYRPDVEVIIEYHTFRKNRNE